MLKLLDHDERILDINRYFDANTTKESRIKIINKYKPNYILINKDEDKIWREITDQLNFQENVQLIFEDNKIILYSIH